MAMTGAGATVSSAYWSASSFSSDQYAQANLSNSTGNQFGPGIAVRLSGETGYFLWYGNSANTVSIWRMDSSTSWTQLAQSETLTVAATDVWMIQAVGSTISAYQNGNLVTQTADATYSSGSPGIWLYYASNQITNWSAGDQAPSSSTYSVGGTVTGLSGSLVLRDNGGDNLTVTADGSFTFPTQLQPDATYDATIATSPPGQSCAIGNATGTVGSANVSSISVTCTSPSPEPGQTSDDFNRSDGPLGANWTDMAEGGLAIVSQTVAGTNASGNSGDIRTAEQYTSDQYSAIQLSPTQLTGNQWIGPAVRAQNGGADEYLGIYFYDNGNPELLLFKRSSGNFTQLGATGIGALAAGTTLEVTASGATITFLVDGNAVLTVTDSTITGGNPAIMASGTPEADNWSGGDLVGGYSVGGTVAGLSGTLVLQDNGGDNLSITANGTFSFPAELQSGAAYHATIEASPPGQSCTIANATGTVDSANATSIAVTCSTTAASYSIGGSVSGGSGPVVLENNGGDALTVSDNGSFTFDTNLASGSGYNVTVVTNPPGQSCIVTGGSGTVGTSAVTNVSVSCAANPAGANSDDFNRADGPLGSDWTDMSDGGLTISSGAVAGTAAGGLSGDMRTGEPYSSDQYSQLQLTATQLTGNQWIGPAIRLQDGGQDGYVGIYAWDNGSPEFKLYERTGTTWIQLGNAVSTAPLAAGSTLKLMAVGASLAFTVNGVEEIAAADTKYSGGAPGIIADGTAQADNWSGGTAGFEAHYLSTDANGIQTYDMISAIDGDHPELLRVLQPSDPAPGVAHNFLFVLPVEPGENSTAGDAMSVLESLNARNQYNLTIVEPTFSIDPWYADNPDDQTQQQETFMADELAPWVKANLATTGSEQSWLIGFSKSGIGGQDLLLKHPDIFTLAASWDFPADASSYDEYGASSAQVYGTNANFLANYQLSAAFLDAHKAPFTGRNRIWIGGYGMFQQDMADYDALLTAEGIEHTTETPTSMAHRWDSGWVSIALAALYQDSLNLQS
jgi:hypothetical protein